jgi:hypothetical protein
MACRNRALNKIDVTMNGGRWLGTAVKLKFGAAGVDLLPAIESIQDLGTLRAREDAIPSTATADEFRKLLADAPSTD